MSKFSARKLIKPTIFLAVIVGIGWFGLAKLFGYELTVTQISNGVELHTLQLGEYYTPVKELSIYEESGNEVVRFVAENKKSMMHTVAVESGQNVFGDHFLNSYSIIYSNGSSYSFQPGKIYNVKVLWQNQKGDAKFVLPKKI